MRSRLRLASCLAVVGALLVGCSESTSTSKAQSAPATAVSDAVTAAPTTARPMTASASSTTTLLAVTTSIASTSFGSTPAVTTSIASTSTLAATTVPVPIETVPTQALPTEEPLPTPAAAPVDPNGSETRLQIGTIEIPRINVTKPMFEGVTLTTLNRGPGHWPGTALPGQIGNVVIGGHRVSHDRPFRNIDKLDVGDDVFLTTDAGRFDYKVVATEVVTPDAVRIIDQTPERTATLFACTPPGSTSHRLVIHLALSQ